MTSQTTSTSHRVEFEATYYQFAHGRRPSGFGVWCFGRSRNTKLYSDETSEGEFSDEQTGELGGLRCSWTANFVAVHSANFTDAKKAARQWARLVGVATVYVLS